MVNKYFHTQVVALIASAIDFAVTIFLKEIGGFNYVAAVGLGACCGAVTAFMLNRHWVFKAFHSHILHQALRYIIASGGGVLLNTSGTYALTETFGLPYLLSKTLVSLVIGLTYSFYVVRSFVFHGSKA